MKYSNKTDLVIAALCGVLLASKIGIPFLYVSAYVILVLLSAGKAFASNKAGNDGANPMVEIIGKLLLIAFVVGITYVLFIKLGIEM